MPDYLGSSAMRTVLVDKNGIEVIMPSATATQNVSGTVAVSNLPETQAVTGPVTNSQLRASPLPVSGSVTSPSVVTTGGATLAGLGQRLLLNVTGLPGAMIHIQGTGVMSLKFSGTADADGVGPAGRRLWKAGVGSLGVSAININGAIDSEYRVVLGGQFMSIEVTAYTSGSVQAFVIADQNSPMVFVSGPVHTALEEATRAGRTFNASTGVQSVNAANFLNFRFVNPAGSGKLAYVYSRRFDSNMPAGATPAEYGGISTPVALTGSISLTPSNMRNGAGTSVMQATYNVSTTRLDSSPTNATPIGGILTPSTGTFLEALRIIPPGASFGTFIGGNGGGLAATGRYGQAWFWFEEDES